MTQSRKTENPCRVYENGRYRYRFRCPECGQMRMYLAGISVCTSDKTESKPCAKFLMHCEQCGSDKSIDDLPLAKALDTK